MKKITKISPARTLSLSKLTTPLKFTLLAISTYAFEGVGNQFRSSKNVIEITIKDFLFFTNISLFYTLFCVIFGYFLGKRKRWAVLYEFVLVTSFVLESMVTILFWVLFYLDPYLVKDTIDTSSTALSYLNEFPKHLFPLIILSIEQHGVKLSKSWNHRIFLILFCVLYFVLIEIYFKYTSDYLYPLFKFLNNIYKVMLMLIVSAATLAIYELWLGLFKYNSQKRISKK